MVYKHLDPSQDWDAYCDDHPETEDEIIKTIIIMRGPSGAGKSTYVKQNYPSAKVVSADRFFIVNGEYRFDHKKIGEAHLQCFTEFTALVHKETELIVVDNTNIRRWEFKKYLQVAEDYGYEVRIVTILCKGDEIDFLFHRNTHNVPRDAIERMVRCLEPHPLDVNIPLAGSTKEIT